MPIQLLGEAEDSVFAEDENTFYFYNRFMIFLQTQRLMKLNILVRLKMIKWK